MLWKVFEIMQIPGFIWADRVSHVIFLIIALGISIFLFYYCFFGKKRKKKWGKQIDFSLQIFFGREK